ncbi:hypothetical protein NPIL_121051 [Nephila pilipes]|uniref:Uncharacterized protein n=1 Tax=Nephila pilipes TaxID=299642 RepID=A0A8X6N045_NEPPI|nr:hypothetical protein NPIL_121051 [Nephila pilipes]
MEFLRFSNFTESYLTITYLISDMIRKRNLATEEAMPPFNSLFSNCSGTPIESLSDEEMSIPDPPIFTSTGFKKN